MQTKYAGKAEQHWSSKIATQKNNPRELWSSSVNRLLKESKEPATTDLTAESFQAFFNNKVEDIHSDTADAPSPMYAPSPECIFVEFDMISVEKTIELIHKAPLKQSALHPIPTWIL